MRDLFYRSCPDLSGQDVSGSPLRSPWRSRAPSRCQGLSFLLLLTLALFASAQPSPTPSTRVGIPLTLTDLYIPGGEARPKPRPNREPPIVVRLLAVKPAQDGKRYDFEIYGLEEGDYDLATFLEAVDPATPPQFPAIPVTITTKLPPGLPRPGELDPETPGKVGGYTLALWIIGILWLAGLLVLLFFKRRATIRETGAEAPASLADRLRALLTAASQGDLDADQKAHLERLILGHWRQRLPDLAELPPSQALSSLRHHEQAGPLLLQLEQWLHARESYVSPERIDELLDPYRD